MQKHWVRVISDEEIEKFINSLDYASYSILEISGDRWKSNFSDGQYESKYFPKFDISNIVNYRKNYDLIILEHVLEHISNPSLAINNIYKLLNPDGFLIVATPFLVKIHRSPKDYMRWTEEGLKYFIAENGFDFNNVTTGQWGNKPAIIANLNKWVKYNPLIHSLKNDDQFPAVVWAFAKK
ncbi:MAG: methyltransferase type 12 [Candidatus Marinimicrobia bacterium]|nr:methyltransferase type 12 [Candidatus Neomarinimicrobiota bacterium]|tara:strand:+ start:120 stop:662 length:543 start_codon:yes stop_codon:yes gene_type:complete